MKAMDDEKSVLRWGGLAGMLGGILSITTFVVVLAGPVGIEDPAKCIESPYLVTTDHQIHQYSLSVPKRTPAFVEGFILGGFPGAGKCNTAKRIIQMVGYD